MTQETLLLDNLSEILAGEAEKQVKRADGEIIGEGIVHIQVLPRALQVIAREEGVDA